MKKKLAELARPDEEDTPGMDFARQYGHAVYSASIDFLESNRHLIEEIATEEEAHV